MLNRSLAGIVISVALYGCNSEPSAQPPEPPVVYEQIKPTPNFAEFRKGIYYYTSAVSENDKADGKAAGEVLGFRYLGKNEDGEFELAHADFPDLKATCADPCKIIHSTTGSATEYTPNSVIGAAFEDAMNGFLEEAKKR